MNIQQLEYLVAVDEVRHFARAAELCFVTQPTLSTMIQRLEDELNVKIFDRSKHPIEPTEIGKHIIAQSRLSLKSFSQIKNIVDDEQTTLFGKFHIGVIPTVAAYLVPQLLSKNYEKFPNVELIIRETPTSELLEKLADSTIDGGILAGPINNENFTELPVYYEKFYAYVSPNDALYSEKEIDLDKIEAKNLWLLEEEHCFRGQIERLCKLKRYENGKTLARFEAGSIDTLLRVIDGNGGITIIPEMYAMGLPEEKQDNLRILKDITAVREVSLIVRKDFLRKAMLSAVKEIVENSVPKSMRNEKLKEFVVEL
ncbi:MAG: hydrogen peroxide-inducible genes activator [Prevotellaceae bacterium]|jgi:LysR family hydrogen peroxide-inducible transcriptional activator|nr:hydrogen peroxide-inducible genes activator [Prevotellaceae bacterium]